ncbi:HutD family protein [Paenirhodobacter sp.]|uniref:HutD/Ves family protein n=1 Tax=Paenirhodobacter sp. TaxID=1965326 RepID=UPI003B3DB110
MEQSPRLWRRAGRRFTAWKNGGGHTAEILAMPEGAGIDAFDWRISTAEVAQSGPFSEFPGIDRWLAVLEGGPMDLILPDRRVTLGPGSAPEHFPGDEPCTAELTGVPLLDLNVMVRRPLRARVAPRPSQGPVRARYALATEAVPELDLERHDLIETLPRDGFDGRLIWIEISGDRAP